VIYIEHYKSIVFETPISANQPTDQIVEICQLEIVDEFTFLWVDSDTHLIHQSSCPVLCGHALTRNIAQFI